MSFREPYKDALIHMGKGRGIYHIPCLNKSLIQGDQPDAPALLINNSMLISAHLRGHIEMVERTDLAERYTLTERGKQEVMKILEARAWEKRA